MIKGKTRSPIGARFEAAIPFRRILLIFLVVASLAGNTLEAQESLSLEDALARALRGNPELRAAAATEEAARAGVARARAPLLPRLDYVESATRSNNPIYVFGTLLTQGQFTESNFALDALNHPEALNNYQSQLQLRQSLFDASQFLEHRSARAGHEIAAEAARAAEMAALFETLRVYLAVLVSAENQRVLEQARAAADADLLRAEARRDAGLLSEADVLSLRVHLAAIREQQIRAASDLHVLQAELNCALGEPLDKEMTLTTPLRPSGRLPGPTAEIAELEARSLATGPEGRRLARERELARLERQKALWSFFPNLGVGAAWVSDRVSFAGIGSTNWTVGLSLRWNLFNGLGDRARLEEAAANERRRQAELSSAEARLRLAVRRAYLDRQAARERVGVAEAAVAQARESHRVTQARFETGLAGVTDLLRSQNAVLEAEARLLGALYDDRVSAARLELVVGDLNLSSEALKP